MSDDKRTIRHLKRVIEALKKDVERLTSDKARMASQLAEEQERVYKEADAHRYRKNPAMRRMQPKKAPTLNNYTAL